jgi:(p)ppGpp synthase/HD superfamily hydrolase
MVTAKEFAFQVHEGQMYGDVPYWHHLQDVVTILSDFGFDNRYIDAGWLHDTCEVDGITDDMIEERFGRWTRRVVWACYGTGATRLRRNATIYHRMLEVRDAIPVKVADRIAHVEAAEVGSKFAKMYLHERIAFYDFVAVYAPQEMKNRLHQAYVRLVPEGKKLSGAVYVR